MRKVFAFIAFWLSCMTATFAQQYPVQVTPQLIPPYTLQVSEYYSPVTAGAEKLRVMLLNRDLQRPQLEVRLRMVIESQSLRIRTREDVVFTPITLVSGTPYYLSSSELTQYFNAANLEFSGISAQQYEQTGKLPEGFYTFCFDAVEVQTNQSVSSGGCAFAWMTLNEPPFLNMPARSEVITPRNPQNIVFNWTPRHTASPTAAFNTDYIFSIIEITDEGLAPEAAFTTGLPLFIDSTTATTYLYDVSKPQLVPGKKYAWRVQAKGKSGTEDLGMFRNQGYSETWWFTYKNDCNAPLGISATPQGQNVVIQWQAAMQHLDYKVEYREKNNADAEWFNLTNTQPRVMLTDLKPNKQYEYRVGGACEVDVFNYSDLLSFTTNGETVNNLANCGDSSQIPGSVPPNLLQTLNPGDTILAGDFKAVVAVVSGSGSFTGEGFVKIPWLFNIKVGVRFNGITVNTDKKLVSGVIETTYDPTESGIADIDELLDAYIGGYQIGNVVTGAITVDYPINFIIPMPGGITASFGPGYDSLTGQGPVTLIITPPGGGPADTIHTDHLPVTLQDAGGNVYQVNPNGSVTSIGAGGGDQMVKTTNTKHIDTDKAVVKFVDYAEKQVYAFDEWKEEYKKSSAFNKEYERLNDDYYVSAKAIAPGKTDYLKAVVTIKDTAIKADSIRFVNGKGTVYQRTKLDENVYEISIVGGPEKDAQNIYALYPIPGSKTLNFGKVLVASYPRKDYTVKLVRVNGASVNADSVKNVLSKVYNPVNVYFKIEVDPSPYTDQTWDLNGDGKMEINSSSILSSYSDEMKKLISGYRNARGIDGEMSYIFILDLSTNNTVYGEMPRNRRFGFIFTGTNIPSPGKLIAHELGHGLFSLKHTFDEGFNQSDVSDNLLNYNQNQGTYLAKRQWDFIHDPSLVFGLFEDDEDSRYVKVDIQELDNFRNTDQGKPWDGTYTFLASSGRPITLPKDITDVYFDTADPFCARSNGANRGYSGPIGGLNRFSWNGQSYLATAQNGTFIDYRTVNNESYIDVFSGSMHPQRAVVAFGWFEEGNIGFDLYWLNLPNSPSLNYEENYTAKGPVPLNSFSVVDIIHPMTTNNEYNFYPSTTKIIENWNNGVKGQSVQSFVSSPLSPFAVEYLNQYKEHTKRGSLYAPILIANAYWITAFQSTENVISCQMQSAVDRANELFERSVMAYENRYPHAEMESWGHGNYVLDETALKFQNELEREYRRFRSEIGNINSINAQGYDINNRILISTDGDELNDYLETIEDCMFEKITIDNRIKAINLLEASDNEETIVRLIESVKYNGQQAQLINRIFDSNSQLFFKLWNTIDGNNFVEYIKYFKTIAEGLMMQDDVSGTVQNFSFEINGLTHHFDYSMDKIGNLIKIYKVKNTSSLGVVFEEDLIASFRPDEFVNIYLPGSTSYITYDESNSPEYIKVPAFYIPYLIWCKRMSENAEAFKVVRVLGDLVAIALAAPSGGSSLTLIGGIGITVSSLDITIALAEEELRQTNSGQAILAAWNYLQWIDVAAAGVNGLTKLTKQVVINGVAKSIVEIKYTLQAYLQDIKTKSIEVLTPSLNALRTTIYQLQREGLTTLTSLLRQRLVSTISEALLHTKYVGVIAGGSDVKIKNFVECYIEFEGKQLKLFNIEPTSTDPIVSNLVYGVVQSGDELVGHLPSLHITNPNGAIIRDVVIYYRRAANQIILNKGFGQIDEILLAKLEAVVGRNAAKAFAQANLQGLISNYSTVWAMVNKTTRGEIFEEVRALTDYTSPAWNNYGQLKGGNEPLIDFYHAGSGTFVQQKTTNVTLDKAVATAISDLKRVIDKMAEVKATHTLSTGQALTINSKRLDVLVPSGYDGSLLSDLVAYGNDPLKNVIVNIVYK